MLLGRLISKSTNQDVLNPILEATYSGVFISVSGSLSKLTTECLYLVLLLWPIYLPEGNPRDSIFLKITGVISKTMTTHHVSGTLPSHELPGLERPSISKNPIGCYCWLHFTYEEMKAGKLSSLLKLTQGSKCQGYEVDPGSRLHTLKNPVQLGRDLSGVHWGLTLMKVGEQGWGGEGSQMWSSTPVISASGDRDWRITESSRAA